MSVLRRSHGRHDTASAVMQPHLRQTEQGPPASRKPRSQLRPDHQARHAGPVSGVPHFDVDPRRGTELGDRRQHAQQTSMIASHAESAGSLRSEAADTLRYDRWPRRTAARKLPPGADPPDADQRRVQPRPWPRRVNRQDLVMTAHPPGGEAGSRKARTATRVRPAILEDPSPR
jgi:hypothetical protein